jgi:hypothetical protein
MEGVLCSGCGTLNSPATKFCIECGTAMSEREMPEREPAVLALPAFLDSEWARQLGRSALMPIAIFLTSFVAYYLSTTEFFSRTPPDWYKHYVFLAEGMLGGGLDLQSTGIPDFYQDVVRVGAQKYIPFPPAPALLLMPFVALWGTGTHEYTVSMLFGALNVVIFWYVLRSLNISAFTQTLMIPFFAFGTVHFYAATTGTVWFFAHVAAVMFLLLAILSLLRGMNPVVPAILVGLAFLSRQTTILAAPFFLYVLYRQHHDVLSIDAVIEALKERRTQITLASVAAPLASFVALSLIYNWLRFEDFTETGYQTVYEQYAGIPYSYYLTQFPDASRFNLFDVRNVPLHLHAMFMLPPNFYPDWSVFRPSPYGMSILLTSPPFIFAFLVRRKTELKLAAWVAIILISIPIFLHFSQGWVQYGYRFMLDFAPFLLLLTALGFDDNGSPAARRWQIGLVALSIVAGFWGRYWANQFVW